MSAIVCKNIAKGFILEQGGSVWRLLFDPKHAPRFHALKGVSLEAPEGRFVGLLGRNGAGKSTLLRILGGVYSPDSGTVIVNGDAAALYELGITGNDFLTGRAFANRWLDVFGAGEDRSKLIEDILDFSELGDAFDREIKTYSAGMKARLFFAIATAREAEVFIIDEVLAVGDEYFQNKCWRRLRQRLSGGVSGIIATHDWSAILKLCPSSYIIEHGAILASGASPSMVRKYLGLEDTVFSPGARFSTDLPARLSAHSLEDFSFRFGIDVDMDVPVGVAASIETFRRGFGWEHLLHLQTIKLADCRGVFDAMLSIPALPLTPGDYALNLSLVRADGKSPAEIFDARGWTSGNELRLEVLGTPVDAAVRAPLHATILGAV